MNPEFFNMGELYDLQAIRHKLKRSKAWIYKEIKAGAFPKPVKMGRSSAWLGSELENFVQQVKFDRDYLG